MTIFFSPAYTGHVYIDFTRFPNHTAFNCCFKNTEGLVEMLGSMLGVCHKTYSGQERLIRFYELMHDHLTESDDSILTRSFSKAPLATAQKCLQWADELSLYGWDPENIQPSKRLQAIADIYRELECMGQGDYISAVMSAVDSHKNILSGSKIIVPFKKCLLPPYVTKLFDLLENGGCDIDYDTSGYDYGQMLHSLPEFEIWHFDTELDALRYLSTLPDDEFDIWVNKNNRKLDLMLKQTGNMTTGSKHDDNNQNIYSLLYLAVRMFGEPIDIQAMLQWLQLPHNPLDFELRNKLAKTIADLGGYHNPECKEILDVYPEKNLKYLPKIKDYKDYITQSATTASKKELCAFIEALGKWAKSKAHSTTNGKLADAFSALASMTDSLSKLVSRHNADTISSNILDGWLSCLSEYSSNTLYEAEAGCREIVNNNAAIIGDCNSLIICDAYGEYSQPLSCSFLSLAERKSLMNSGTMLWNEDAEREFNKCCMMYPFSHTRRKIVMVVCDRCGCSLFPVNPLKIWVEGTLGETRVKAITISPVIDDKWHTPVTKVCNRSGEKTLKCRNTDKLKWREHESPSSLEKLLQRPLDYMLDYLVGFYEPAELTVDNVASIKGKVAHYVIEILFSPSDDGESLSPIQVETRVNEGFDDALKRALHERGAYLLHESQNVDTLKFAHDLRRSVANLAEIIVNNKLSVFKTEYLIEETKIGLKDHNNTEISVYGFVDMILKDEDGSLVIFDHKFTSWPEGYKTKLANGEAYQLELYKTMLSRSMGAKTNRCGYFIMPAGVLYTNDRFKGKHVYSVQRADDAKDALSHIKSQYPMLLQKIKDGGISLIIESGEQPKPSYSNYMFCY